MIQISVQISTHIYRSAQISIQVGNSKFTHLITAPVYSVHIQAGLHWCMRSIQIVDLFVNRRVQRVLQAVNSRFWPCVNLQMDAETKQ